MCVPRCLIFLVSIKYLALIPPTCTLKTPKHQNISIIRPGRECGSGQAMVRIHSADQHLPEEVHRRGTTAAGVRVRRMFRRLFLCLLLSCSITTCILRSSGLLTSCSVKSLAPHNTIVVITTHFSTSTSTGTRRRRSAESFSLRES